MIKIFEVFYTFWKVFSFGMFRMQYRAMGSICLVIYFIVCGLIEMFFPDIYPIHIINLLLAVFLIPLYEICLSKINKNDNYLKHLDNKFKDSGIANVLIVLSIKLLSFYFFVITR